MRKIIALFLFTILSINVAMAEKNYSVNFNGNKFQLLYSIKNKDFGGYLNEYYKKGETYNIWTEMIAVHHFPNAYSPIDRIKDFKDYLSSMHVPSSLTFDDKKNTAMIDFIMISNHNMPIVIEFNIFKYEKSKKCGSVAIQYAKRYTATTTMQIEMIKKDIEKNRKILVNKIKNISIPEIITKDIDKCISANNIIEEYKKEETANKQALEQEEKTETQITETEAAEKTETENSATITDIETVVADNVTNTEETKLNDNTTETEAVTETNITKEEQISATEEIPNNTQKTEKISEEKEIINTEHKQEVNTVLAPTYVEPQPSPEPRVKASRKKNKKTDNIYQIKNDKNEFIANPRTKNEIKEEIKNIKSKKKERKKQAKIQAKYDKLTAKKQAAENKMQIKLKKKEEKIAAKLAKTPYTVANNKSDLISQPRTKKELKEEVKKNKEIQRRKKLAQIKKQNKKAKKLTKEK